MQACRILQPAEISDAGRISLGAICLWTKRTGHGSGQHLLRREREKNTTQWLFSCYMTQEYFPVQGSANGSSKRELLSTEYCPTSI